MTEFELVGGDLDMINTLGMSIKEGRDFSAAYPSDSSGIIFNEAAIRFMALKNPIGQQVTLWDKPVKIVGPAPSPQGHHVPASGCPSPAPGCPACLESYLLFALRLL
jgi:hypothetical protein